MITYYRLPQTKVSFRLVADRQMAALKKLGHDIQEVDLIFNPDILSNSSSDWAPIGFVHPLFFFAAWQNMGFEDVISALKKRHQKIYGFEVADTTSISERFAGWANHPLIDGICLPSQFSMGSYQNSGVTTPLHLVPHGVEVYQPNSTFNFLAQENQPKILCFVFTEAKRKGWDLVQQLIGEFPDVLFVVKAPLNENEEPFKKVANVLLISSWLSNEDMASLYHNCDLLLSLHRGGGFEMNCLEALAYGLPVVATGFGSVMDYLNADNASLVKVAQMEKLWPDGMDHNGMGATADLQDAKDKINLVLNNKDQIKQQVADQALAVRQKYSWNKVAETIRAVVES